jgi:hypothetical protein
VSDGGQALPAEPDQATAATLWADAEGHVRLEASDAGDGVVLSLGAERHTLSAGDARALARALARAVDGAARPAPEGSYFQVYYVHEYRDGDGVLVPCPALDGDPEAAIDEQRPGRYTWDAPDAGTVRAVLDRIGEAVAELDAARAAAGLSRDPDNERPWVSLYRMPEDERIWKGPWDALDEDVL